MQNIMNRVRRTFGKSTLITDQRGLSSVEYVVLLVLIVGAAIVLWTNIRDDVTGKLTKVHSDMTKVTYP
jgi:Flp pilus assembly pilin Flp